MTTKASFSAQLKRLSNELRKRAISQEEYRRERKRVLDDIDRYFNGADIAEYADGNVNLADATVPYRLEDPK